METVKHKVSEDRDLGDVFKENENPLAAWMLYQTEETHRVRCQQIYPLSLASKLPMQVSRNM